MTNSIALAAGPESGIGAACLAALTATGDGGGTLRFPDVGAPAVKIAEFGFAQGTRLPDTDPNGLFLTSRRFIRARGA